MPSKITRRVAIGSFFAVATAIPFIVSMFRHPKQLVIGMDPYRARLKEAYEENLSFPRTFDPDLDECLKINRGHDALRKQPQEIQDKVYSVHHRYWENFSRIDEVEMDFLSYRLNPDGTKWTTERGCMDAHVWLKYGYGFTVKGVNGAGEPIDWIFNLDGDAPEEAFHGNISGLMWVFVPNYAVPFLIGRYAGIYAENVPLMENPHLTSDARYDVFPRPQSWDMPLARRKLSYERSYFNKTTGMLDMYVEQKVFRILPSGQIVYPKKKGQPNLSKLVDVSDPRWEDPASYTEPVYNYEIFRYVQVNGIYFPCGREFYRWDGAMAFQKASNVKVKLLG